MKYEIRRTDATPCFRIDTNQKGINNPRLVGYAAKFGVESCLLVDKGVNRGKPFVEVLEPGCFKRTLVENPDVRAIYNHDTSDLLGRTVSNTLSLVEDETGLAFDLDLPDTQPGRDVRCLVSRGDITGCSFGFCIVEDSWQERPGLPALRTIHDLDLHEITPACAFPAYEDTEVAVRTRKRLAEESKSTGLGRLNHALRQLILEGSTP